MAINLARFELDGVPRWGVVADSGVSLLAGDYPTTAALIERGEADLLAAKSKTATLSLELDQDPAAGDRPMPHLLSGGELPPAHDRIRHGSGREAL